MIQKNQQSTTTFAMVKVLGRSSAIVKISLKLNPSGAEIAPATTYEILTEESGKFVLVLDRSTSMINNGDPVTRFEQLKQSTMRWIKHDIRTGSQLGIVSFW